VCSLVPRPGNTFDSSLLCYNVSVSYTKTMIAQIQNITGQLLRFLDVLQMFRATRPVFGHEPGHWPSVCLGNWNENQNRGKPGSALSSAFPRQR
jgi:hypothetical protein